MPTRSMFGAHQVRCRNALHVRQRRVRRADEGSEAGLRLVDVGVGRTVTLARQKSKCRRPGCFAWRGQRVFALRAMVSRNEEGERHSQVRTQRPSPSPPLVQRLYGVTSSFMTGSVVGAPPVGGALGPASPLLTAPLG